LALSKEHEKCVERVTQTPKYRTLSTHCSSEPSDEQLKCHRGPILIQARNIYISLWLLWSLRLIL